MNSRPLFLRRSSGSRALRRALFLAMALLLFWAGGLVLFIRGLSRAAPAGAAAEQEQTEAIAVLTGGSERLAAGLELLAAGRAQKLFVSGVYHGVDVDELLRVARRSPGDLECCIVLGYTADNTEGNAQETASWMRAEGFRSIRLVTANYHMPRSLLEFRMALPDVAIIPHPVAPIRVRLDRWWSSPGTATLLMTEYSKYLLAWVRYALMGDMAHKR